MKLIKNILIASVIATVFISCNHSEKKETAYVSPAIKAKDTAHVKFKLADVDNKMDPSCMMPLTAGIGDTLHYKGLVLGFCSAECKKDFFKDTAANLKLAQIKTTAKSDN